MRVPHSLQVLGYQGRTEAASTIEDDLRSRVRQSLFNVALDDALAEVNRPRQVVLRPLAFLADIDDAQLLASIQPRFHVIHRRLADVFLCFLNQLQETRRMMFAHDVVLPWRDGPSRPSLAAARRARGSASRR